VNKLKSVAILKAAQIAMRVNSDKALAEKHTRLAGKISERVTANTTKLNERISKFSDEEKAEYSRLVA
jgi:hypothetical protein